jgi:perosamine synthetase
LALGLTMDHLNYKNRNFSLSSPDITDIEINEVLEVLKSRHLSQGPKIEQFEKIFSEYIGCKYAIAVNSGTSALHLVVRGLGLKEGDEVITTPFSFVASSNCLLMEKVNPIFVDIDEKTYNINPDLIEKKINEKTKAILVVHVFGYPADMDKINKIAKKHNLFVIEDACEALGAESGHKRVGNSSTASVFAFYPNKQITTGEGGIILTNNDELARLCKSMRNQGRNDFGEWLKYERLGFNYRLDEMSAALGIGQMKRVKEILQKREDIANLYMQKLKNIKGVFLPYLSSEVKKSWFVFTIQVNPEIRDKLMKSLQEQGISCRNYFPPIHLEPFYRELFNYNAGDFPITEKISKKNIALPFYNQLTEEEIDYIVEQLKKLI